jgi:hypothetical protein
MISARKLATTRFAPANTISRWDPDARYLGAGKPITPKERPRCENVVDLTEALRKSVDCAAAFLRLEEVGQDREEGDSGAEGDVDADRRQGAHDRPRRSRPPSSSGSRRRPDEADRWPGLI